jgi:hypothetical protein
MNKIRRICLLGGACSGKSITATNIRSQMGFAGYDIELVDEVIKDWTYIPRVPASCDSIFLLASQIEKEDIRLRAGVDLIVSDSPLILQYFYAKWHKVPLQKPMLQAALEFEELYPSIHIFIERKDKFYSEVGRYETLAQAKEIDVAIKNTLRENHMSYSEFSCLDQEEIISYIIDCVESSKNEI